MNTEYQGRSLSHPVRGVLWVLAVSLSVMVSVWGYHMTTSVAGLPCSLWVAMTGGIFFGWLSVAENAAQRNRITRGKCALHLGIIVLIGCIPLRLVWSVQQAQKNEALMDAVFHRDIRRVKVLVQCGADVNTRLLTDTIHVFVCDSVFNHDFPTVLMFAADTNRIDIVKVLLDHGAYIDAEYWKGGTALNWETRFPDMERYLISRGAKQQIDCPGCRLNPGCGLDPKCDL